MKQKPVIFIEGLVYNGLVKQVDIESCEPSFARVRVVTEDGHVYVTRCMHEDAARKLASVWRIYITKGWNIASLEPG